MNKKYLLSMNRKDAKEIFNEMFKNDPSVKFPRKNIEVLRVPAIATGEFTFGLANVGDGVFNLYQYEN